MSFQIEKHNIHRTHIKNIEHFYQPIYNVHTRRLDRAEVLLRVRDGQDGYLDTETFVHEAEAAGLIGEMDRYTFCYTCGIVAEFQAHGIQELEINFSPAAYRRPGLAKEMSQALAEHKIAADCICLEITEATTHAGEENLFDLMRQLRKVGITLAIDDFGKGHSNFQRLAGGPFQVLKLDKELVQAVGSKTRKSDTILQHVIRLAAELELQVVAEGVETEKQARLLIHMGCDFLQGYYFSPPVSKEELFVLLTRWATEKQSAFET